MGERARAWALTMAGHRGFDDIVHAHPSSTARIDIGEVVGREAREERENLLLRPGATRARLELLAGPVRCGLNGHGVHACLAKHPVSVHVGRLSDSDSAR